MCHLTSIKEKCNLLLFKEVLVLRNLVPVAYILKENVEIFKIYMVIFNVKIWNRPKKRGFKN